ncbi:hypothetical protein [Winogradskyella sp. UBA3174]|uniref:hypothetical protein n=1 Tax=Winogradskyella sp. UBA3174 TaxID=1947785 RepID=UPI0025DC127F|nr:hypothetical protein [Winogradskyella sp. UBA3174]
MRAIILIIFLTYFNQSFACDCKTYPIVNGKSQNELKLEDSFKTATIIFYGNYIGDGKFESIKLYRGKKLLLNRNLIEEKDEANNCDYYFEKNKKYLVFGRIDEYGKLWTSVCGANAQIDHKSELKFVKKYLKK